MTNPRDRLAKLQRRQRDEFEKSIAKAIRECPTCLYSEIGKGFQLTAGRIAQIAVKYKVRRRRGPKTEAAEKKVSESG
jgi:hypothetical protein